MVDLKRKVVVVLLAVLFVAGTLAISGCKGEDTGKKTETPKKMQKELE